MISGMLVFPQLRKEAIFLINSNQKDARLRPLIEFVVYFFRSPSTCLT